MSSQAHPPPWPLPIEWLPSSGRAEQLILLLHGAGQDGRSMAPLAQALRGAFAQAAVLAPDWPVDAPLAALLDWVQAQQTRLGVGTAATALGGFAQGANAAVALALAHDGLAGRVLVFAGQLHAQPVAAPRHTTLHWLHGADDHHVPIDSAHQALAWLGDLQGDATLDIAHGVGHSLHPALIACALQRLRSHIPLRTWQAALGAAPDAVS
jgi:phospholipase/carboxylesterase